MIGNNTFKLLAACVVTALGLGCGSQPSISNNSTGQSRSSIFGRVHGGQQPVFGASIQLYAVAPSAGSQSTALISGNVTSASDGTFTITGDYSCPSGAFVYLTATGGSPGLTSSNSDIALMTALGACSSLTNSTFIQVNELTTVAAVAALAPYMTSFTAVGSSDAAGLTSAFSVATQLVSPATGSSPGTGVPSGVTIPVSLINTLGDIVASCVNSAGGVAGDGSTCGQLLSLTTGGSSSAPTNTIAALLNLAYSPALNPAALFGLITPAAPFQPELAAAPASFAIFPSYLASQTPLQMSPASLIFPVTGIETTAAAQTVTIQNTGSSAVAISAIALVGLNASEFSQTNNCPASILASASCSIQVTVTPTTNGAQFGFVEIDSSSAASPQYVPLAVSNPAPILNSLSPVIVASGNPANTPVALSGFSFLPSSVVQVGGSGRPTTYVSSSQLIVQLSPADVAASRTLSITVVNPIPGGGTSAAVSLSVATYHTPVITYASPNAFLAGAPSTSFLVYGGNLTNDTVVQWNGQPLPSTPIYSQYTISSVSATVPAQLLTSAGTAALTLYDPGATPSTSNSVSVTISNPPAPTISSLPVPAGPSNTATQLVVYGTGFTLASTALLNGRPVPTTVTSTGSLTANIPAYSIAAPGIYTIGVTTAAPGGGTAATTLPYTAYVALANNSMIYNPSNGLLYASVPSSAGAPYGNSIVSVDPATGALGAPIYVGSEPDKLALTADGRYLWVGLDGASSVRQVDLNSGTAGLQFAPYGVSIYNSTVQIGALAALPGSPNSVIVATDGAMPAIYDNGVLRGSNPATCSGQFSCLSALAVNSTTGEIYGASTQILTIYTATSTGLAVKSTFTSTKGDFTGDVYQVPSDADEFQVVSGSLYTDAGTVYNSETGALLGTFYNSAFSSGTTPAAGPTFTDAALGETFILDSSGSNGYSYGQIQAFNSSTYAATSAPVIPITVPSTTIGSANPYPSRLFRWGSNGLTFRTAAAIFSVRSNSVNDLSAVNADLGVTLSATGSKTTGSNTTYVATVTDSGPAASTNVAFSAMLPAGSTLVSVTPSAGSCAASASMTCDLGGLASGQSASVTLVVTQLASGSATLTASVTGSENDPVQANNSAALTLTVTGANYNAAPTVSAVSPAAILAGSQGTTITITGTGFTTSSDILLGGTALPTVWVSSTQLTATVPSTQLEALGWTTVSVANPAPGGGTSAPLPLSIFTTIAAGANHIVYDPYSRKIMASIGSGTNSNSIAAITPETATVGTPVAIGTSPQALALTPDGQILYTALGTNSVVRFNMLTQQPDFSINIPGSSSAISLGKLAVQPGTENTVAIDLGPSTGTAIYNFNPTTKTAAVLGQATGYGEYNCPQFLDASDLLETYAYSPNNFSSVLVRMPVPAGGFVQNNSSSWTISTMNGFVCAVPAGGLAYGSGGVVADPTKSPAQMLGIFQPYLNYNYLDVDENQNGIPDTSLGRSFFIATLSPPCQPCIIPEGITAYNQSDYLLTNVVDLRMEAIEGSTSYSSVDLVRWGQDGLAALTSSGRIYLLRGPVVTPQLLNQNTAATLTSSSVSTIAHGSGNTLLTLAGTNFLPGVAVNWNGAYRTTTIVDATHITVAVPASDLVSAGSASLTASNPGAPASSALTVTIN